MMTVRLKQKPNTARAERVVRGITDDQLDELAGEMVERAGEHVPRLTGNLARSITHKRVGALHQQVHTETGYGAYVELGTSRQRAQPYMAPGFHAANEDMARRYPGVWRPKS